MKHKVKVGQEFDGLTITIMVDKDEDKKATSFKKTLMYVAIAFVICVFLTPVALGMATGDYAMLKGFAESGKAMLDLIIEIGMKHK